jgi:hypothetical protein
MLWSCPVESDLPDSLKWTAENPVADKPHVGIIAGPVILAPIHYKLPTKICRRHATNGKLVCACDKSGIAFRIMGYVPLILKDMRRVVVTLSAQEAYKVQCIATGTPVKAVNPGIAKRPIKIMRPEGDVIGATQFKKMMKGAPHDISEYLLYLWQDRLFTEWCGKQWRPSRRNLGREDGGEVPSES